MKGRASHPPETIERALLCLALNGGALATTERQLRNQGHPVSRHALRKWRDHDHRDRYLRICHDQRERIAEVIAAEAEEVATQAAAEERAMLSAITKAREAGEIKPGELPGALRNVTTTKSLNIHRIAGPLRGRPSAIVEHRNPDEILKRLARLAPGLIVDSTAEEIGPSEAELERADTKEERQ